LRLALIANDRSGKGLGADEIAAALRARGAEVVVHSIRDHERVLGDGPLDRIVVAGGDGSIGICADLAGRLGVPLAVIPAGTANDFARAHDLPDDPEEAAALAVEGRRTEPMELGRLRGRPFVNVVSAGLSPVAARHAHAHKPRLGPLAYAVGAIRAGLTAKPVPCDIRVDGERLHAGDAWQIIVSVSGAFGGGSHVQEADPRDGRLHVTVVPGGSRLWLLWRAAGMRRGDIAGQPGVPDTEGHEIDLGLPAGSEVNLDGELCGPGRLTVEPAAFSLVVG
jgi:diacylglycerol kinase family enzyme